MSEKAKTVEEIRSEFQSELRDVLELQENSPLRENVNRMGYAYDRAVEVVIARATVKFDHAIKDKKRWLEMGEAADSFIQAMKLPPVEVKK